MRTYPSHGLFAYRRLGKIVASAVGLSTMLLAFNVGSAEAAQPARAVRAKDFEIGPKGPSLAIAGGRTVRIPITIRRGKGFTSSVTFTINNPFAGVVVTKEDVTASGMTLVVGAQRDVTFQQGYIVVTAKGGRRSHSLSVMASFRPEDPVEVAPDGFGATAAVTSTSTAIRGGDTIAFTVKIQRDTTTIGPVKLSVTNNPVGLEASFPYEVIEGDEGTLFVRATELAAPGQYSLSLRASTDNKSVTIQVPVTVA
jgi:hypothetical protein